MFQGEGAASFVEADKVVTYASLYDVIALAPQLASIAAPYVVPLAEFGWSSLLRGPFGPALGRVFWSGGQVLLETTTNITIRLMGSGLVLSGLRAAEIAEEEGGMTLEMTPFGRLLTELEVSSIRVWRFASAMFAQGAQGRILVVQSDVVFRTGAWATVEFGLLLGKNEIVFISSRGSW